MDALRRLIARLYETLADPRGQTMAEYAIIIAWVALLVIVGATTLGRSVSQLLNSTAGRV